MKKNLFLMLTFIVLSAASANAQVRIGGTETDVPTKGAVLDLNNSTGGYVGGLLLPKVTLTDLTDLSDIPLAAGYESALEGLIVYNTTVGAEGIYIWNGSDKWEVIWKKN
ncbi:MAG: hypothetical protein LBO74_15320 [Candidatus Symbiothrix sp.]|nr:hypothetical protein [Candidatus Symbiothrix sp.]